MEARSQLAVQCVDTLCYVDYAAPVMDLSTLTVLAPRDWRLESSSKTYMDNIDMPSKVSNNLHVQVLLKLQTV